MNCICCSQVGRKCGSYRNRNRVVQRYFCDRCGVSYSEAQPLGGLRVDFKLACQVVHLLCEGMGIRAIQRFTGLHQETVLNILKEAGERAERYCDAVIRQVKAEHVQADEMHCIVGCRQQTALPDETERGAIFTFLSIDRDSKLIINWLAGKRTRENAQEFMQVLGRRLAYDSRLQLTTDNWQVYSGYDGAVATVFDRGFSERVSYATETKYYARPNEYSPRQVIGVSRRRRFGQPDMRQATICHMERTNLSVRLFTKRFARCTLGYSKKLDNLRYAIALFAWHFNFVRIHSAHGKTPAVAAQLADKPMTIAKLLS